MSVNHIHSGTRRSPRAVPELTKADFNATPADLRDVKLGSGIVFATCRRVDADVSDSSSALDSTEESADGDSGVDTPASSHRSSSSRKGRNVTTSSARRVRSIGSSLGPSGSDNDADQSSIDEGTTAQHVNAVEELRRPSTILSAHDGEVIASPIMTSEGAEPLPVDDHSPQTLLSEPAHVPDVPSEGVKPLPIDESTAQTSLSEPPHVPDVPAATQAAVTEDPATELIQPKPLASPVEVTNERVEVEASITTHEESLAVAADPEKQQDTLPTDQIKIPPAKLGFFARQYKVFRATYAPTEPPPLVFPSGPTDKEKMCYVKTYRLPIYAVGVFSFLSLSAGMWLFVIAAVPFYWFGAFAGILQIYLLISYCVSILGKDFDMEKHNKVLQDHPITPETCPTVDIYLPCCKEPLDILANTYKYIKALNYPKDKLKVYVLDDGGMDAVKELAASYDFTYICRDDKPRLKKAGNLRWAFARTTGDFFNIYDADFCPRPDFLLETVPEMLANPKCAIIQTPQFFRTTDEQTWIEQGAGSIQELFYRLVQVNRNRWGASICVGSNALYRREALEEVGGTAEIGFSEDVHTGFYAVTRGWEVRYMPLCLACGICPDTCRAFFSQQMRWCMGSTTLLTNKDFWTSNLSLVQKICYCSGMMYYSAFALSIFLNPAPGILLLWFKPEKLKYYNLAFVVPSILYSLLAFRFWARSSWALNVQFIMVIQSYAYLSAIKDRIFGTALAWVPSGDTKAHKNNKYRNMRILAWCWTITWQGFLISGVVYHIVFTFISWWNLIPLLLLNTFNLFLVHRFLFCTGN